jgi:arylsulfatase
MAGAAAAGAAAVERPNVLLIMTDQHRADAIGAYGNAAIRTPHIDSLARGGTRFTNHWTQHPVCMPSRACVFTGRYPSSHGVRTNGITLPRAEVTLAHVFQQNGYRTGGAGKFHFVPHYNRELPTMESHPGPFYGFTDFHLGEDLRGGEQEQWIAKFHATYAGKPDHQIPVELHNSHWAASHTIQFIRECSNRKTPFFAFCSFVDPHHPYDPPAPYSEMYKEADMPPPILRAGEHGDKPPFYRPHVAAFARLSARTAYHRTQYYGEVSLIDDSVGRILKALSDLKLRDNTIIVFTSDHGDVLGDHGIWYKGFYHYASCACTALIVNWPGRVKAGKVVTNIVQQIDIFPTLTALAGAPNPPGVQGRSQTDVLTTDTTSTGYESALIEFGMSGASAPGLAPPILFSPRVPDSGSIPDLYTLRTLNWRMSYYPGQEYGELYDLEKDPGEFTNRWKDPSLASVRRTLKEQLLDRVLQTHNPLPIREERY